MTNPYSAPEAEVARSSNTEAVSIPGVNAAVEVRMPNVWSGYQLMVNGQPAEKRGWFKRVLPKADGGELEVRFQEGLTGPVLVAGKEKYEIGPRVPAVVGILCFVPIGTVAIGGVIGGLLGGLGYGVNRIVARTEMALPLKLFVMLLVAFATFAAAVLIAGAANLALRS